MATPVADRPSITPVFPLLLLETMRDMDRPQEVLEDEDITTSLPRRLGLSEVVRVQIQRFQEEVRQRRPQAPSQVEDLIRLVVRRPDSGEIFQEAGRRVAVYHWERRSGGVRSTVRFLPGPLARIAAQRAARRLFQKLVGSSKLALKRWPVEMRIQNSLSARAAPGGEACRFYAGAFAELLQQYTGREYRVLHPQCEARSGAVCLWTVEIAS